jgi:hypothetical protein
MKENLEYLKQEILRKIYVLSCVNGVWRIKYNDELYSLYKGPNIEKIIKIAIMKLLGHMARMEDNVQGYSK